jgi:hypothetical protein
MDTGMSGKSRMVLARRKSWRERRIGILSKTDTRPSAVHEEAHGADESGEGGQHDARDLFVGLQGVRRLGCFLSVLRCSQLVISGGEQ